jgi:uncharacterized membrane protein YidH (DUF202 family)
MHIDIRKPTTHKFGIERPNQSGSGSSDDPFDSDEDASDVEDSRPSRDPSQRLIGARESINEAGRVERTNGGGGPGGIQDEEERAGDPAPGEEYPLYDSEDDDSEDETGRRNGARKRSLGKRVKGAAGKILSGLGTVARRNATTTSVTPQAPVQGITYARKFKAPPGKRIFVPVRVEPKVYFAAERTFLSWFEFSVYLGAIAGTLLNFGDRLSIYSAWGFTIVAILALLYSMGLYLWRVDKISKRRAVRYHDKYGPTALCGLLLVAVGLNFWFRYGELV